MSRSQRTDPAMLDRLRQARAAEDTALAAVSAAQTHLDAVTARRAAVVADLDVTVENAELELAQARAGLVEAAGLDRAAHALGLSRAVLRRSRLHNQGRAKPAAPHATAPELVGGAR